MRRIEELDTSILISFEGNPRFDTRIEEGLLNDIKKNGILVPILVCPGKDGSFEVIDGERRRQCATRLRIPRIPCIIEKMDNETKWSRAFQLNIERQSFSPMEEAQHLYERKRRFNYSDEMLADRNLDQLAKSKVTVLVALNKLPEEIKQRIHEKRLAVDPAYQLSRLAFDVEFPSTGPTPIREWADKRKGNIWDFTWLKEPKKWKEERIKHQLQLANKYPKKLSIDGLKYQINSLIELEKEHRERKGKRITELQKDIEKYQKSMNLDVEIYNEELQEIIEKLNYQELEDFKIDLESLPPDILDFAYEYQEEINSQMPDEKRMRLVREAKNSAFKFQQDFNRKKALIFSIGEDPACPHCGQDVNEQALKEYFEGVEEELKSMENLQNMIMDFRDDIVKRLNLIKKDFKRLKDMNEELKKLEEEEEESENVQT